LYVGLIVRIRILSANQNSLRVGCLQRAPSMHLNGAGPPSARKQPRLLRERRETKQLHCYEHARFYCYHLDWKRIPLPGSGLELSYGPWLRRKCSFLNAFPCPMARFRAPGRERDSGVVLVLEHRGKRADVPLFYFPARSGWHPGLSSELAYLHSQFDADSQTQVRFHGSRPLAAPARIGPLSTLRTQVGLTTSLPLSKRQLR